MSQPRENATDDLLLHMAMGAFVGATVGHTVFGFSTTEGAFGGLVKGAIAGTLLAGGGTVAVEEAEKRGWFSGGKRKEVAGQISYEMTGALGGGMIVPAGGDGPRCNPQRAERDRLPAIGFWRPTAREIARREKDRGSWVRTGVDAYGYVTYVDPETGWTRTCGRDDEASLGDEDLPWPGDFVDAKWKSKERSAVAAYLDKGRTAASYRGWSTCRLCGKSNGSQDLSDDAYVWPQGFGHYVRDHGVKPPAIFIQHALRAARERIA